MKDPFGSCRKGYKRSFFRALKAECLECLSYLLLLVLFSPYFSDCLSSWTAVEQSAAADLSSGSRRNFLGEALHKRLQNCDDTSH